MNYEALKIVWLEEERRPFSGWDFSCLESRWHREPLRWDYKDIVKAHLHPADQLLDIGTGGGEFLLSLGHPYEKTSATEAWQPNIQLCMKTLLPLGIRLYPVQSGTLLPIADDSFDIVINRHESYDLVEVSRILKRGGMFITQQVGGENCASFAKRLNNSTEPSLYNDFSLSSEKPRFLEHGFEVQYSDESYPELRFFDVGAVVFWAKIIKWSFPGFSVESNFAQLCSIQDELAQNGFISVIEHRFILVAHNCK